MRSIVAIALIGLAPLGGAGTIDASTAGPQLITDVRVLSPQQLVAVGSTDFLASGDGGATWRAIPIPDVPAVGGFVLDARHWWSASASTGQKRVTISRTSDAGMTWREAKLPGVYPDGYGAVSFSFEDARRGWLTVGTVHSAAFAGADLYKTTNGGASWQKLGSFSFSGPILFRDGRGFALSGVGGQSLETSVDAGRTWRAVALPVPVGLRRRTRTLAFVPSKHGVAVEAWFEQTSMKYPATLIVETSIDGRVWSATKRLTANFGAFGAGTTLPVTAAPGGGWIATNAFTVFHSTAKGWTATPTHSLLGVREILFPTTATAFALVQHGSCQDSKSNCAATSIVARSTDGGRHWTALALDGGVASAASCQPAQVTAAAGFQGATGSELGGVTVTNTSGTACSLSDSPPSLTISWQGTPFTVEQEPWPTSASDLLHAPVRVLAPGASAEIDVQWFNWCGTPSEGTDIQPSLELQFTGGSSIAIAQTEQPMGPPRCDAPSQPSLLNVSGPLTEP